MGHIESGSNKISNLISNLGHGAQSEYSGQSFKPVETDADGNAMDNVSLHYSQTPVDKQQMFRPLESSGSSVDQKNMTFSEQLQAVPLVE